MIPVKDTLVDEDTLPGREIKFGIGDPRWLMRSTAKLYSDIITAIIREYSTNAYDAHLMAGNPDPIQVTLPSILNPFFVVEDKGVGMDIEDFEEIYTQFGVSNKRQSEATNGLMGLGSKSGIAYTTQFTVTSIKNGIRTEGLVKRKPDWEIVLKVVSTRKTDEPNGTKITIPVPASQVDEFAHKAAEFYKWWMPGRVLVNGREPEHNVGKMIVPGLYYSNEWNKSYIVMGNVAYRINNPDVLFYGKKINRINFVAYVDNGEVEFTPAREDLEYSDVTRATLQRVVDEFEDKILATAKAEIDAATTHAEAYQAWTKWTNTLGRNLFADLQFKGDKFEPTFKVSGQRYRLNYGRYSVQTIREWDVSSMQKTMFVTDFGLTLSSRHKQMVNDYAKLKGWNITYAVFTASSKDGVVSPWISKDQFITYEALKAAVPTPTKPVSSRNYNNPNAGRVKGSWDYYTTAGKVTQKSIPTDDNTTVYYIHLQIAKSYDMPGILRSLGEPNTVVIEVPGNRFDKFQRENPSIKNFIPYAQSKVVVDCGSLLSDEAKEVFNVPRETRDWVRRLDKTKVNDPEIARIDNLITNEKVLRKAYDNNLNLAQQVKMWYTVKKYEPTQGVNIYTKYPMLDHLPLYGTVHEHTYLYMNAVHAAAESE